jgi:hypothetical protein
VIVGFAEAPVDSNEPWRSSLAALKNGVMQSLRSRARHVGNIHLSRAFLLGTVRILTVARWPRVESRVGSPWRIRPAKIVVAPIVPSGARDTRTASLRHIEDAVLLSFPRRVRRR